MVGGAAVGVVAGVGARAEVVGMSIELVRVPGAFGVFRGLLRLARRCWM